MSEPEQRTSKTLVERLRDVEALHIPDGKVVRTIRESAAEIERLQQRVAGLEAAERLSVIAIGGAGAHAERVVHLESALHALESRWLEWDRLNKKPLSYHSVREQLLEAFERTSQPPTAYSVPHVVMDAIYETLKFYANLCSYEGARTGGVLAGCPRGPNPTPADLVVNAQEALWMLDRDVLGRLPVTKTYSECGACDTSGATCSNQYGICSRHGGRRTGHPQWASPHNGSAEKTTSDGVCPVCGWPVGHCNVGCTAAETEERHKPECSAVAGSVYCDCGEDERLQKLSENETPRHE